MLSALVVAASMSTALVSGWMTVMYLLLRHQHYAERALMSALICAGALAAAAGAWRGPMPVRATIAVWAVALLGLGLSALGGGGDDGWVVIAALLFVVEGAVCLAAVARATVSTGTA
jgi:hypothetical protein